MGAQPAVTASGWVPATSRLVAATYSGRIHPPLQLAGSDDVTRGWALLGSGGDTLYADEFGDLWWGRESGSWGARLVRPCWPEEARALDEQISASIEEILSG